MGRFQPLCHKTKSCKYHAAGRCKKGPACTFAHGSDELLPRPAVLDSKAKAAAAAQAPGPDASAAPADASLPPQGLIAEPPPGVPWLPQAPFAMGDFGLAGDGEQLSSQSSLREDEDNPDPEDAEAADGEGPKARTRLNKFHKTQLCMFHQMGKCKKRASCRFAHGTDELRPVPDLYRTKLCPTMLEAGQCTDEECRFAHSAEELRHLEEEFAQEEQDGQDGQDVAQGSKVDALTPSYIPAPPQPVAPGLLGSRPGAMLGAMPGALPGAVPSGRPELPHPVQPPEFRLPPEPARGLPLGLSPGLAPGGGPARAPPPTWAPGWGTAAAAEAAVAEAGAPGLPLSAARLPLGLGEAGLADMAYGQPPWRDARDARGSFLGEMRSLQSLPADPYVRAGLRPREPEYPPTLPVGHFQSFPEGPCPASGAVHRQLCPALLNLGKCTDPACAYAHVAERQRPPPAAATHPGSALLGEQLFAAARAGIPTTMLGAVGIPPPDVLQLAAARQRTEFYQSWPEAHGAHAATRHSTAADALDELLPSSDVYRRHFLEGMQRYGAAGPGNERLGQPVHSAAASAYLDALSQEAALESRMAPRHMEDVRAGPPLSSPTIPRTIELSSLQGQSGYRDLDDWSAARGGVRAGQGPLGAELAAGLQAREEAAAHGSPVDGEPSFVTEQSSLDLEPRVMRLRVKNTFLTVQEPSAWKERPRSRTLPVPSMFEEEEEEGLGLTAPSFPTFPRAPDADSSLPSQEASSARLPQPPAPEEPQAPWLSQFSAFPEPEERAPCDFGSRPAEPELREGGTLGGAASSTQAPPLECGLDSRLSEEPSVRRLRVKNTFLTVEDPAHVEPLPRSRTLPVPSAAEVEEAYSPGASPSVLGGPPPPAFGAYGLAPGAEAPPPPPVQRRGGLVKRGSLLPKIGEGAEGAGGLEPPGGPPLPFQGPRGGFEQSSPNIDL